MLYFFIFLLAYFTYFILSYSIHSSQSYSKTFNLELKLSYLFSPSYFLAKVFKENSSKEEKTDLLKFWNKVNFGISIIFFILLIPIGSLNFEIFSINLKEKYFFFLFCTIVWGIRCISRSFEIIIAFFNDITTEGSHSYLSKYDRIKLATISYLEVILNFGALYFLIFNLNSNIDMINSDITNLILNGNKYIIDNNIIISIPTFYSNNIFSFTFSSFFISTGTKIVGINPFFILQLSTSLSLLIFAIAGYISDIKNLSDKNNKTN
ncbi:hypothetical protein [uncultured Cetobacterium sp.]|uniref:hypothetical protein n=1 Tax=uncultured Cetobacterium sp. TaxID=527638 RepID=UPI002625160E|nr:hypothetical protein [uncultured Cetobacterium sp.]